MTSIVLGWRRVHRWSIAAGDVQLRAVAAPAIVCAGMVAVALVTCGIAHVQLLGLFVPYFVMSIKAAILAVLVSIFFWLIAMARAGTVDPLKRVLARLRSRGPLLLLPFVVLPLFLVSYTAAKTAIGFLVGFGWDPVWTDADHLIFGKDAWRIAQALLGISFMPLYAWFYTFGWGAAFMGAAGLVAINATPRRVVMFYASMFLVWLVGGWLMALLLSAAGPAFTYLFDPALGARFDPLRAILQAHLAGDNSLLLTQKYLAMSVNSHVALKAGGISAMPSMHVAAASIYVLAARKTRWFVPALLFWLTIFLLSAYFGYHYWVDGIVAAALAGGCWSLAELFFSEPASPSSAAAH